MRQQLEATHGGVSVGGVGGSERSLCEQRKIEKKTVTELRDI